MTKEIYLPGFNMYPSCFMNCAIRTSTIRNGKANNCTGKSTADCEETSPEMFNINTTINRHTANSTWIFILIAAAVCFTRGCVKSKDLLSIKNYVLNLTWI